MYVVKMLKTITVVVMYTVSFGRAQDCVRSNWGDSLPNFSDPGSSAPRIAVNPIQAIIKSYEFHCCGRVEGWGAYVEPGGLFHDGVYTIKFQIWRPVGGDSYIKVGENTYPSAQVLDSKIEKELNFNEQLHFQPRDVMGYYLEQTGDSNGGLQFDNAYNREELWYLTGNSAIQNECRLDVGTGGNLISSTSLGPIISVSLTTSEMNNCPSTFTSTMFCPTPTSSPQLSLLPTPALPSLTITSSTAVATTSSPRVSFSQSTSSTPTNERFSSSTYRVQASQIATTDSQTPILTTSKSVSATPQKSVSATPTDSAPPPQSANIVNISVIVLLVTLLLTAGSVAVIVLVFVSVRKKRAKNSTTEKEGTGGAAGGTRESVIASTIDISIYSEPSSLRNEAYGKLETAATPTYDYIEDSPHTTNGLSMSPNPAYGGALASSRTESDQDYYANEGMGGAADEMITDYAYCWVFTRTDAVSEGMGGVADEMITNDAYVSSKRPWSEWS